MSIAIAIFATVAGFWLLLTVLCAMTGSSRDYWRDRFIKAGVYAAAYTGVVGAVIGLSFALVALWRWAL